MSEFRRFEHGHDYPRDTVMEYVNKPDRAEITLSFTSEDPLFGTETVVYGADGGTTLHELATDLLTEIGAYLDDMETDYGGEWNYDSYYSEYTKTALYAFEEMLIYYLESVDTEGE